MTQNLMYKYKAIHENGTISRGVVAAKNETDLYHRLHDSGYQLISYSEIKPNFVNKFLFRKQTLTLREKIQFYKSMEQMLKAGIPLLNALEHCTHSAQNSSMRDIVNSLHSMVADGTALSKAMYTHKKVFSRIECTIVRSNEETGDFENGFKYLCLYLTRQDDLKRKIKKATMYPLILLFVIIVAIVVMLGVVVPQILSFLVVVEGMGELPLTTKTLMYTSNFFQAYWIHILIGGVIFAATMKLLHRYSTAYKYRMDAFMLSLPMFGDLVRKLEISRFCTTFASLNASGIKFVDCIRLSGNVINNSYLREALISVRQEVIDGRKFTDALVDTGQFPTVVIQMFSISEETGNISKVMEQIVEFYDNDVDDAINTMVTMLEPILTAVLAGVIIWIAAAVFGPIYNMFGEIEF